ncbi:MAG TPA: AAA family ATPase [Candidatus Cybelea sp.]|nr:AAA family ATPase [Candidatus Cybelea sp.]
MIVRPVLCRPFIGRRQELAYLRERRLEAGLSHGGLVLVVGDAGVGKSRLISEFCGSLAYSRWKIAYGACLEFATRPYGPILEAVSRIDPGFEPIAAATKHEQFDAIVDRLASIATRTASLLVVEDLHWADAASLDLLAYLGPKLQNLRVLVVASVRGDELPAGHPAAGAVAKIARNARAGRIDLAPLRGSELRGFIDEALDGIPLPEETRRAIALAGDGNPFFTEELLKSAVEQSETHAEAKRRYEVPQSVRSTVLERLHPFDETERRIVTQAAVIGRTFGLALLAATLDAEPATLLPALRRARDLQLVEEVTPEAFRFRHGLTRDAICGEFLGAELQPRHRTIGLALEGAPPEKRSLEALAYHWWAAKDSAKACRYNELAGDAASSVHAHEDAIAFYERTLEFDMDALARGTILKKVADRRLAMSCTKEAQATYEMAADIFRAAGEYEREAGCRAAAAITAYGIGLLEPTAPLEAMLARLDVHEYLARSRVHLGLAWLAATFGFPTRAGRHLERVDARALQVPDVRLRFHNVAAFAAMTLGDLEGFRREFGAWSAAAEASGAPQTAAGAYINGAMCFSFFGLHEEAQANIARALRLSREARSRHSEEMVHAFAALCALLRGDLAQARAEIEQVSTSSENRVSIVFGSAWGSVIGAALDDRDLIERWFDGFETTISARPDVECGGGFAEIMARRGRARDAADLLHRALPECELLRGNVITLLAVARYGARDDRERARGYLERAASASMEMPERPALALFKAFEYLRDGLASEAAPLACDAAAGFYRLRMPLLEAEALEAAGEPAGALALFRRCGATYHIHRLEGASAAEDGTPRVLSAREHEIATLAARGKSNLEIAKRLSITHKTVEKHLASAYQKLGIGSRAQLGAKLGISGAYASGATLP